MSYYACETNKGIDIVEAENPEQVVAYIKTCYGDDVQFNLISDDPEDVEIANLTGATIHGCMEE